MSDLPLPDDLEDALHKPGERQADHIIALFGRTTPAATPPAGSRERLLARLESERANSPAENATPAHVKRPASGTVRSTWRWLPISVACAAGLMLGLLPAWHWHGQTTAVKRDHDHALATIQELNGRVNALQFEAVAWSSHVDALRNEKISLQSQAVSLQEKAAALGDDIAALRGEKGDLQKRLSALQDEAARNEELLAILRSSQVQSFVLRPTVDGNPGYARILWDQQNRRWHLRTEGLPVPAQGRTYELWFITPDQRKIAAGTFDVDAQGKGDLLITLPPGLSDIALAAVTDEPRGGVAQPTGSIHLAGKTQ